MISAGRVLREVDLIFGRVRGLFHRVEPLGQARKYVLACASGLPKVNGWTVGEFVGDLGPDKTQRFLSSAVWADVGFLRTVRRHVVDQLRLFGLCWLSGLPGSGAIGGRGVVWARNHLV
jgi:hypothetical protein